MIELFLSYESIWHLQLYFPIDMHLTFVTYLSVNHQALAVRSEALAVSQRRLLEIQSEKDRLRRQLTETLELLRISDRVGVSSLDQVIF